MPLSVSRSTYCHNIDGGAGAYNCRMLEVFFKAGQDFHTQGFKYGRIVIFATLVLVVADEKAMKTIFGTMGHAGLLICGPCRNVVGKFTDLESFNPSYVKMTCCDPSKFLSLIHI